ncbi:hypothetical protein KK062_00980 [Fulvivirgaceae bacterium PWU5]|uniref:histidine kinase n=1 Tax=Dawidia cretensis TaxID=2782350 RepID=A0AAP2DSS9_9BACT|nr:ATP-binding protein [Dawidia cretensis]MBT1706771.1 hypothetical protein [Dawidia cretensis]
MLTRLPLLLVFLLVVMDLSAQEYRFHQYRVEQGLPSDVIKAVAQDSLGFFWIATDDGIVKYDGLRFTTYRSALRSQYAKGFLTTRKGRLLAIADLDLIEIKNQVDTVIFHSLLRGTRNPTDTTIWYGKTLYEDRHEDIWIAETQAAVRFDGKTMKRYDFGAENRSPVFIRSYNFFEDQDGNFYAVGYAGKVFRFDEVDDTFVQLRQTLPGHSSHVLFENGKLLVAAGDGLYEAILRDGEIQYQQRVLSAYNCSYLLRTSDALWVCTFNADVYRVPGSRYEEAERLPYSFIGASAIFSSKENDLWVASDKGLVLVQKNQFQVIDLRAQAHFIEGMAHDPKRDVLYYCSKEALLELYHGPDGEWEHRMLYFNRDGYFQALQFSAHGGLWASTASEVLLFQNDKLKKRWDFAKEGGFISDVFIDKRQNIWLSQGRARRVKVMSTKDFSLRYYDVPLLKQSQINVVREGKNGIYLASSGVGGYLFYKPHDADTFKNVSLPVDFPTESDLNIHDLAVQNDVIWLASTEGLLRYDQHTTQRIDLGEPLTGSSVSSVETLDDRYILFSNSYGLMRYDVVTGDLWLYDENTGLPSNTITDHGILADQYNRLWIGTSFGLALAAKSIRTNATTAQPFCTYASVNGVTRRFRDGLQVPYGAFISLMFSPITFPENKINMQWRLDSDSVWHSMHDHTLTLSDLSAGRHTLQVRAKKNTGLGWSRPTEMTVTIGKPYWQKAEFIFLVLLTALMIAWISYAVSAAIMKKRKTYLHDLIEERTVDLQKANEELLQRNAELDRFVYSASHDLSAPLKSVLGLIMVARMDKSIANHEQYLDMMERSIRKLEKFIEEVVSYSRNTRMPVKPETFLFTVFVQNLLLDHQYAPNYGKIKFEVEDGTGGLPIVADVVRLKIILNNLISNAIKFHWFGGDREPTVRISLTATSTQYTIVVQDNGRGIDDHHLAHIFDMFYRASEQAQGSGLGLYILKESVLKLGGTVEARSKLDEGTTFVITLPVLNPTEFR